MKFSVVANHLAAEIKPLVTIAPTKGSNDILRNILIEAKDDYLVVTGSDLTVTARQRVDDVKVFEEGSLLVDAQDFLKVINGLEDDEIEVSLDKRLRCRVQAGKDHFKVAGESTEEYPQVPSWDETRDTLKIKTNLFKVLVDRTHFAADKEEGYRHAMKGIFLEMQDGVLRCVATDSRRMAICERDIDYKFAMEVLVPKPGLLILPKIFDGGDDIEIQTDDYHAFFRTAKAELWVRIVEGNFPPYRGALDMVAENHLDIPLQRKAFLKTMTRATLLSSKTTEAVRFVFDDGLLTLEAYEGRGAKEAHVQYEIDYAAEPMVVGFRPMYFKEGLMAVDGKKVTLKMKDENTPAVMREESEDGTRYTYVIVPVSLRNR